MSGGNTPGGKRVFDDEESTSDLTKRFKQDLTWKIISGTSAEFLHLAPPQNMIDKIRSTFFENDELHQIKDECKVKVTTNLTRFVELYKNLYKDEMKIASKIIPTLKEIFYRAIENEFFEESSGHNIKKKQFISFLRAFKYDGVNFLNELYIPWSYYADVGVKGGMMLVFETKKEFEKVSKNLALWESYNHWEVLLVQEQSDLFGYPKGSVELFDNDPLETSIREVQEELGLTLSRSDLYDNHIYLSARKMHFFVIKCDKKDVDAYLNCGKYEIKETV